MAVVAGFSRRRVVRLRCEPPTLIMVYSLTLALVPKLPSPVLYFLSLSLPLPPLPPPSASQNRPLKKIFTQMTPEESISFAEWFRWLLPILSMSVCKKRTSALSLKPPNIPRLLSDLLVLNCASRILTSSFPLAKTSLCSLQFSSQGSGHCCQRHWSESDAAFRNLMQRLAA